MSNAHTILKLIKDKEIKFVDLRFTDPRGKWQHVTFDLSLVDEDFLTNGPVKNHLHTLVSFSSSQ